MKKLKQVIIIFLIGILLIGTMGVFGGCDACLSDEEKWKKSWKKEDGFYYRAENGTATIYALVDSEKERDELVIPEKLGGCKVNRIGREIGPKWFGADGHSYGIWTEHVKKTIINHDIEFSSFGICGGGDTQF